MRSQDIIICFRSSELKKYIERNDLVIGRNKFTFKYITSGDNYSDREIIIDINTPKLIEILNIIFDFLIEHNFFFYEYTCNLYNIDINLFAKSTLFFKK